MPSPTVSVWVPILTLVLVVATDLWVYSDAKARAEHGAPVAFATGFLTLETPLAWFVACLILWILFFPLYLTIRDGGR